MSRRGSTATILVVGAVAVGAYTYLGFPALLRRAAARRPEADDGPAGDDGALPTMTVVVPAHDEAAVIEAKVADVLAQDYPTDRLDVLVVEDGSTDGTGELARRAGARVISGPARTGKSDAVNRGVAAATGTLVCLTDANTRFAPGTLRALARRFEDPRVAVVSGAKRVVGDGAVGEGEGLYWRMESRLKMAESAFGCVMGAVGEVMAVRRSQYRPIPADVVNDDLHLALDALSRGSLVRYAPDAVASETVSETLAEEYERRTRIAAGTWQGVFRHLELLDPSRPWHALSFASHRVLRSVVLPFLLCAAWVASLLGTPRSRFARRAFLAQTAVYGAAAAGAVSGASLLAAPFQFAFTNLATIRGAWRYLTKRQPVAWRRAHRAGAP